VQSRPPLVNTLQVLFYPTAIGSEPEDPSYNSYPHWTRTMLGHAAANLVSLLCWSEMVDMLSVGLLYG
jgi:hypothetical protein